MTGTTLVLDRGYAHDLRLWMPVSPLEEYDKLVRNPAFLPSEAATEWTHRHFICLPRHTGEVPPKGAEGEGLTDDLQ